MKFQFEKIETIYKIKGGNGPPGWSDDKKCWHLFDAEFHILHSSFRTFKEYSVVLALFEISKFKLPRPV